MKVWSKRVMTAAVVAAVLVVPTRSHAQLRGLARIAGTVSDDGGAPMRGVSVKASVTGRDGVVEVATDEKGAFSVNGVGKGEWHIVFWLSGYAPVGARVTLEAELARVPPVSIVLKRLK